MITPEVAARYWHSFQEALEEKVATIEWNPLQPLKVIKHGLHWVVLFKYPGARVKFYIFEAWDRALNYALNIAAELRKPLELRYAQPV